MKFKLLLLSNFLLLTVSAQQIQLETNKKQALLFGSTISQYDLNNHLTIYASDEFEGRETGEEGQKKAVQYLRSQYMRMGIEAAQQSGDYFQKFSLTIKKVPSGTLTVGGTSYENGDDFMGFSGVNASDSHIVYVGYGIDTLSHSDYDGLDVEGEIVVIRAGEPEGQTTDWGRMSEGIELKQKAALKHGAKAVIYIDQAYFERMKRRFDYMKKNDSGRMSIDALASKTIPTVYGNDDLAATLLADVDNNKKQSIKRKVSINLQSKDSKVETENVVAYIEGSELPEEYIVISSHLDHVGVNDKGEIFNGADDDGSGTVALLEVAEAFKKAADKGNGPKRSVVFLHVTGEEKGLLGSRYYTDVDPVFSLDKTIANLNIDMVGRIDPKREGNRDYVYLIGSDKLSLELHQISELVNDEYMDIELDYTYNDENDPNRFYYRSDHYNFAKNNIPIIFYFNGTHDDYHRASDTVDKINFDLLENRTRLVFYTAWEIANRNKAITVDRISESIE
jgi:hypothetical protein